MKSFTEFVEGLSIVKHGKIGQDVFGRSHHGNTTDTSEPENTPVEPTEPTEPAKPPKQKKIVTTHTKHTQTTSVVKS